MNACEIGEHFTEERSPSLLRNNSITIIKNENEKIVFLVVTGLVLCTGAMAQSKDITNDMKDLKL